MKISLITVQSDGISFAVHDDGNPANYAYFELEHNDLSSGLFHFADDLVELAFAVQITSSAVGAGLISPSPEEPGLLPPLPVPPHGEKAELLPHEVVNREL